MAFYGALTGKNNGCPYVSFPNAAICSWVLALVTQAANCSASAALTPE
jgi:hypothetical protein